jgi:hypothetical protein
MLGCRDGSFYTGVTTEMDRRLREHQEGTASPYTRTRHPGRTVLYRALSHQFDFRRRPDLSFPRRGEAKLVLEQAFSERSKKRNSNNKDIKKKGRKIE